MEQNYSSTKFPTAANSSAIGGAVAWSNPSRITADDGSSASWGAFAGAQMSLITATTFGFQQLPDSAVIDGVEVFVDGTQSSCYGNVTISATGTTGKAIGAFGITYGGPTDLWGADSISLADIASLSVGVEANDVSGGDGTASIDYLTATIYWHIELTATEVEVPTRIAYKVYSRDGDYLGELPNVSSKFSFAQDINSAGSAIVITCGEFVKNEVTVSNLLTEAGDPITTESDLPITVTETDLLITTGNSDDNAIFKNSNRIKVWVYNKWHPNGKLEFSGQVNKIQFKYGGADASVKLTVYSDGLDLNNYVARGYPFSYTTDVTQSAWNDVLTVTFYAPKSGGGWETYGQSWTTGAAIDNIGAIVLALQGTAEVTVSVYDAPNGNLIGSATKSVSNGAMTQTQFEFPSLIPVSPNTQYFFGLSVPAGQSIKAQFSNANPYSGGSMYNNVYSGGSGGGVWGSLTYDLVFITKSGTPTTTVTYTSDDPVADMAHGILLDYNARGGLITERDFDLTGLSLTYTFVVSFIYDAIKKILELCPTGYYFYIDLGTAEIDIKLMSTTADFTVVRGRHINELDLILSIEPVKNYLLLSGGDTGGGSNLYRDYTDAQSASNYGIRTLPKSDNRITLTATADAVGTAFIEENGDEVQETMLKVLDEHIDISLLTNGKTIGFKNFGNFIDDMVLQIVRREPNFSDGTTTLTLGRLPVRTSDEIQRISRGLLNEQTINNPSAPS